MSFYEGIARPLLFRLSPERAHRLSLWVLQRKFPWRILSRYFTTQDERLNGEFAGIPLKNPIGLATGFDKDCQSAGAMMHLGFGYIMVGSILRDPRRGNPRPRIVRYPERFGLVNCMGLPSQGIEYSLKRLGKLRNHAAPVIANMSCLSLDVEQYIECFRRLEPWVDAVEVSLKCPNVRDPGSGRYEELEALDLLTRLLAKIKKKPLIVKIRPNPAQKGVQRQVELARLCQKNNVDGLTVCGGKVIPEPSLSLKEGNLTGKPVLSYTLETIRSIYAATGGAVPIKASGGIFTGSDVFEAIKAGATAVELYTALVYRGWRVARKINAELVKILEENNLKSISEVRGTDHQREG